MGKMIDLLQKLRRIAGENPPAHVSVKGQRSAAVLVPILTHTGQAELLLTKRTAHLHNHAGQVSFPGGMVEANDADITATALRETQEEIGLDPKQVEILGHLPAHSTGTGFYVTPVLGVVAAPYVEQIDTFEVETVFNVPFPFLLGEGVFRREEKVFNGIPRRFYAFDYGGHYIWGATAHIIATMVEKLKNLSSW
jgi:8-oxo-dGTP pyrophosphatase MutT (NUDIX family)